MVLVITSIYLSYLQLSVSASNAGLCAKVALFVFSCMHHTANLLSRWKGSQLCHCDRRGDPDIAAGARTCALSSSKHHCVLSLP